MGILFNQRPRGDFGEPAGDAVMTAQPGNMVTVDEAVSLALYVDEKWLARMTRTLSAQFERDQGQVATTDGRTWDNPLGNATAPPPPAKCEPNCTPANPCMTALVCPAHREPGELSLRMRRDDDAARANRDFDEARQWRSEPYEPTTSGRGGMVGRYRYDRR